MKNVQPLRIRYEHRVVRLTINKTLFNYLKAGNCRSLTLSKHIHDSYIKNYRQPLDISRHSLALEILIHTVAFCFCSDLEALLAKIGISENNCLRRFLHYIIYHVQVIDCGEKAIDNNRFVFDWFAKIYPVAYPLFTAMLYIFPFPTDASKENSTIS